MKLTRKAEAEVKAVYMAYWENYFSGNLKKFAALIDPEYKLIGTSEIEVINSKKETIKWLKSSFNELKGKAEFRKRQIKLSAVNDMVLVTELSDVYILLKKEWKFYSKVRISTFMRQTKSGWKIVHQHGSLPDTRTEDGETVSFDTLSKENLELREAVKRRTVELESKNNELQIEAALERVRTIAMGMKKADDMLLICKTISEQLQKLGIKEIRNVQTAIFYESRGMYMNYEYYAKHNKTFITETSYTNHRIHKAFAAKMLKGKGQSYVTHIKGKKVKDWITYQKTTNVFIDTFLYKASSLNYYWHSLGPVALGISTYSPLKKEEHELFERFLKVFELSYRRYLDIEKATAQAREAQIEAALERVRAAAMAMRNSTELSHIIYKLYGELTKLDAKLDRCFIMIVHPENKGITWWLAGKEGLLAENGFFIQSNQHSTHLLYLDNWKKRKKKWQYNFEGKEKKDWDRFGFSKTELSRLPEFIKKDMAAVKKVHLSGSSDQFGSLVTGSLEPLPEEQQEIISRFTVAFNQAYIRFLDLQKAEASARETAIELGLERVRARAMAMQHSDELAELVATVFTELNKLDFSLASCIIWIHSPADKSNALWIASDEMNKPARPLQIVPFYEPFFSSIIAAWKAKDPKWIFALTGTEKKKFQTLFFKHYPELPEALRKPLSQNKQITFSASFNNFGALEVVGTEPLTDEKFNILHRFGNVFNSSYTRFHDLQKAEAQAREAQIQLALERVRARTMAMQRSDELPETSHILFEQMKELGEPVEQLTIGIVNEENRVIEISATLLGGTLKKIYNHSIDEPYMMAKMYKAWKQQQKTLVAELKGDELNAYNKYRNELTNSNMFPTNLGKEQRRIVYAAFFSKGMLALGSNEPRPPQSLQLLERFASVFDLTYTRFLDLQKAEAQAREAQIEAALEKVRSRSLAMHKSEELKEVIKVVLEQFVHLHIKAEHAGFYIDYKAHDDMHIWLADPNIEPYFAVLPYFDTPTWNSFLKAKANGTTLHTDLLDFKTKNKFYNSLFKTFKVPEEAKLFYLKCKGLAVSTVLLDNVGLYIENFSAIPYTDEENNILIRFGKVFQQTYTRFLDLQKAEAQAREAQIETALEKVRSRTLAMQKSDELAETAAVMFKQLILLGIEPNRLYIILFKEDVADVEAWLTDEDGSKVNIGFTGNYERNGTIYKMYEGWKQKLKSLVIDMQGDELQNYFHYLHNELKVPFKDGLEQKRRVQHLAYFNNGLIGIASPEPQPAESIQLLERFAAVFNLTFTRFHDLKLAEAHALQAEQDLIAIKEAKQKAEEALSELQVTQRQLIQSEKMASLGELTAGIAHEIQNPLNFVNNFSEVSSELIKEMVDEVDKGNTEEAKLIADDLIGNLEKINHHGKRAADIVKGMLQHSRSSSGVKESTDINLLCDEYLRLAYHGLRAKDKSFNATMKTDFDATIGNINIIPQDMGRVILNLITNAFYVVNEKSKQGMAGYEPTVEVSTKKVKDKVEVKVKDNGNGIPQKILDKIFQPFFTTKPTGQGTGLGLSLSYDIVKAHGGELKVETEEGKGSVFIIQLNIQ